MNSFENILNEDINIIDEYLRSIVISENKYQKEIIEAINYSLFTGGKRIRPVLSLETFKLFNGNDLKQILPFAAAIEMIHTYSLIHDDLPAMDDDHTRRGKPTSHIKFGEAMAILAGDGLLNMAFETILNHLSKLSSKRDTTLAREIRASNILAKESGIHGMIGGQVVDLHLLKSEADEDSVKYMYKTKTGGLIRAAILMGAIIGGANEDELKYIDEFSYNLGLAYQLQDDFLDLEEDERINKVTYLSVLGKEVGKKDLNKYTVNALEALNHLDYLDVSFLKELVKKLEYREV